MLEMIILLALLIFAAFFAVSAVAFGVKVLNQKRKHIVTTTKLLRQFAINVVLLIAVSAVTGGFVIISQRMASTPPIKDKNGDILEGSIAVLEEINLNGRQEWISIRGENQQNPVLLFLAGGPGGTQISAVRQHLSGLEKHFTVVVWDQPGSGKSYRAGGTGLTADTYIEDGIALTEYLCMRFHQEKIYLVGESWGSALGIFLAAESPESYHAVIGTGQMVDFLETERIDYEKAYEIAEMKGDTAKIETLDKNGPPPYYGSDVTWKSAEYLNYLFAYMNGNPDIHNNRINTFQYIFSEEYGVVDKINFLRGIVTTFNHVYPQLYGIDLRKDYPTLEVPVYFFLGRHDINAPTSLVEDYMAVLNAPHKEIRWFEHSGHSPWINESGKFVGEVVSIIGEENLL